MKLDNKKLISIVCAFMGFAAIAVEVLAISAQENEQVEVSIPACIGISFTRNLTIGANGDDVKCLQAFLNSDSNTIVADSGAGSPGMESTAFGGRTKSAIIKFQNKYAAEVLTAYGLTNGTGFVGTATRAKLNALLGNRIRTVTCGNSSCENGETAANCPSDCSTQSCIGVGESCTPPIGTCNQTSCASSSNAPATAKQCCGGLGCRQSTANPNLWTCQTCAKEGETIYPYGKLCCSGLTQIGNCKSTGECSDTGAICAQCGNGVCGAGESKFNCPADCGTIACIGAGERLDGNGENSGRVCCMGLTKVFDQWHLGSDGVCRALDSYGVYCLKCGDGICGTGETKCNCPADCGAAKDCSTSCKAQGYASSYCKAWAVTQYSQPGSCKSGETNIGWTSDCTAALLAGGGRACCCVSNSDAATKCADTGGVWNTSTASCACPSYSTWCDDLGCDNRDVAMKPVIYLYPQKKERVNIKLDLAGKLIADYPDYDEVKGWDVNAYPDGHLVNLADNKEYSYLFWEADGYGSNYDMGKGFVVKGSETKTFLQNILAKIGLTPKEYNEFIVYWYPKMEDNPYNIIHFADTEYASKAKLTVTPRPDSVLRVFMVFKPSATELEVIPQTFTPFERKGFVVVEWGGSEIK